MDQVGTQEKLPFSRAVQISIRSMKIRLGRSIVTLSGIVLGIAFLMSNLVSQLILDAVKEEREHRQTVGLMQAVFHSEVGSIAEKQITAVVYGEMKAAEKMFLDNLGGLTSSQIQIIRQGAALPETSDVMIVLGQDPRAAHSLAQLTAGLPDKLVLDALGTRDYSGDTPVDVRRELFFSEQTAERRAELAKERKEATFRTIWIVIISVFVTMISVSNALLMSVTERFREIGTMKCLGALSSFIRTLFLIESSLLGAAGSVVGVLIGILLPMVIYGFTYNFGVIAGSMDYPLLGLCAVVAVIIGTVLSVAAAIYPARVAANMVPADALRSTV